MHGGEGDAFPVRRRQPPEQGRSRIPADDPAMPARRCPSVQPSGAARGQAELMGIGCHSERFAFNCPKTNPVIRSGTGKGPAMLRGLRQAIRRGG